MNKDSAIAIRASEVDGEGVWHWGGKQIPLLGNHVPIPDKVRLSMDPERQEVLAILDASDWFEDCPSCGAETKGILMVTEYTKIFPAHCCDKMVWMTDERDYSEIYEA